MGVLERFLNSVRSLGSVKVTRISKPLINDLLSCNAFIIVLSAQVCFWFS